MLRELNIQNLILISSASIHLDGGFNVLSGETGAGKSAIMKALHLLTGDKTDASLIRHGADKGVVEGVFDIDNAPFIANLLHESGIDHEEGEPLILRREVALTGKTKCVINNQTTQLALLRKISASLLEMVGQHANQKLLSLNHHRQVVDLYGDITREAALFAESWEKESLLLKELNSLVANETQRTRQIDIYSKELEEIKAAHLKEGEEEELFGEYSRLINADEITTKLSEIVQSLDGEEASIVSQLKRHTAIFDQLIKLDKSFEEASSLHSTALVELQEVAYSLERFLAHVENNPDRLGEINERLSLINKLKKKYGSCIQTIKAYEEQIAQDLVKLESADLQIEENRKKLAHLQGHNDLLAKSLSEKRRHAAKSLAEELTRQLQILNMPKAEFEVHVTAQARSSHGDDSIEFFLIPNVGEKRIPIKEHASGGELSRILLALQTLLAGKESIPTLVFDEIDGNIGGETAVIIGQKLQEIGRRHQILCITHFPQVARLADHHIFVEKREEAGRTYSHVAHLDDSTKQQELSRMAGTSKLQ